ncbi:type I-F CRISPR-associated protein Cas7f/Csy3 [Thioalkalivibrio sp. HL-Eb18]|uniref:type I-F CRISPR-associated protein Cas7f/Csy3 n=1 Tax=Thioalkalivibrio sp. HL-Eb18 TaxID=1266913 RepID=UPI001E2CFE4E|nr:type I-F CRISPR-associated protein Cas7f/Csy3 [Thioalkalivibrio sp. HL-Eb18]
MAKNAELHTASVLAFERKLDPSDALLFSGQWDHRDNPQQWAPVPVREKSVRGTISNRLKANKQDPAKLDLISNESQPVAEPARARAGSARRRPAVAPATSPDQSVG